MKRNLTITLVTLAAVMVGAGFWFFGTNRKPAVAAAPVPAAVPVVAATVTGKDVPIYLRGIGTVIAYNTDVVRSQIQGQIVKIAFTEGQTVKAGDLLAQIDPRPYEAQIEQLTANRDRDQAQLVNAEANLSRYNQLGDKGYATPQLIETQTAQVAQLKAAVKADQAQIDEANVQLSYTRLSSAVPGITGVRQIDVGNVIHPTDANGLVVVTQIEPISLLFTLPQADLPMIQEHAAKGSLKVIAYSQDNKTKLDEGTLLLVNNEIAGTTGTVQLKAVFPNHEHRLWPGQLVNARLLLEDSEGCAHRRRLGRAAGAERQLRLCRGQRPDGGLASGSRRPDYRWQGPDRSGPEIRRRRRHRRTVSIDGRQPRSRAARQGSA